MKANFKVNKLSVEFEADSVREIWKQLSTFQEVFGETTCGKCGSENLRFVVRENDCN